MMLSYHVHTLVISSNCMKLRRRRKKKRSKHIKKITILGGESRFRLKVDQTFIMIDSKTIIKCLVGLTSSYMLFYVYYLLILMFPS